MRYSITFWPRSKIQGVKKKTVSIDTAAKAWAEVQGLDASDENTEIRDEAGREISHAELRLAAQREAN